MLGSIFANRLSAELASALPRSAGGSLGTGSSLNTAALKKLPPQVHEAYLTAFTNALSTVFIVAACVAAVAFLLSWLIEQRELRETVTASTGIGESFAAPKPTDSLAEASRALSVLIGREGRRELVAGLVERAGVDLSPAAAWLIVRLQETTPRSRVDPAALRGIRHRAGGRPASPARARPAWPAPPRSGGRRGPGARDRGDAGGR